MNKEKNGKFKWTFSKKVKYFIDSVLGYSYLPLRLMTVVGIVFSTLGFIYSIVVFIAKIFGDVPIKGWHQL